MTSLATPIAWSIWSAIPAGDASTYRQLPQRAAFERSGARAARNTLTENTHGRNCWPPYSQFPCR
jgi:hypothetical protein